MRAMPMAPPPDESSGPEADGKAARQTADGQSSGPSGAVPKKTAPIVQAVIAEAQRQMEMDLEGAVADAEAARIVDEAQMRSAVDGLNDMEAMLQEDRGQKLVGR
jgi:type IV secretion system protein VirD4